MNPKRISVKIFSSEPETGVDLDPFIPLFHRVIQQGSLEGLLVDVADYIHVPNGPGVVLVGHDADYGIDSVGGRTGLLTVRKRAGEQPLEELLVDTLRRALAVAKIIEEDASAKLRFDYGSMEIQVLDRLAFANDDAGFAAARPAIEAVVARALGDDASVIRSGDDDPRKALAFAVSAPGVADVKTLLDRLGASSASASTSAGAQGAEQVPGPQVPGQSEWDISVEQLAELRRTGADFVLVDVREQHEVDICEIGGRLIPLGQLGERMSELNPDDHLVVHCHLGGRSAAAVNALRGAGFENAWNVQGGIRAWIQRVDSSLTDY